MPSCALLNSDDPLFEFEHAMAHRAYMAVMAPLNRFSAMPYFIEPFPSPLPRPAEMWPLKHRQAHQDFGSALPPFYQANKIGFGIPPNQVLIDTDLSDPESLTWWTFANHQEHFIANQSMFPVPTEGMTATTPPVPLYPGWFTGTKYPFW